MARKPAGTQSLLIADDHEVFRFGLAQVLRRKLDFDRVLEAASLGDAMAVLSEPSLKLAIFDLTMPGMEGARDLAKVRRARPDVRLVVLSGSEERHDILAALGAGVHGYIVKSLPTEALIGHIRSIMAGIIYVPPSLADLPADAPAVVTPAPGDPLVGLSERQRQVLKLIADGLSNKRIAHELGIAEGTVKMHVTSILRATGAANRAQAAAFGKQYLGAG